MKLAIMQPYLFPYLGYFQLINAVDKFVVYDDVQYSKGGWVNRNRILVHGKAGYITLPLRRGPINLLINQRLFADTFGNDKCRIVRQIEDAYRHAPHYIETRQLLGQCLASENTNVATFVAQSLRAICDHLSISTPFVLSSLLDKDCSLTAQERVISISKLLGADTYVNASGGVDLYSTEEFARHQIALKFLMPRGICYHQYGREFVSSLSIIDVLMFNPAEVVHRMLGECELC